MQHNDISTEEKNIQHKEEIARLRAEIQALELQSRQNNLTAEQVLNNKTIQACLCGDIPQIELLLKLNVSIKLKDQDGRNLLHLAALHNQMGVAAYLFSKEASLFTDIDKQGLLPISLAAATTATNREILELLFAQSISITGFADNHLEFDRVLSNATQDNRQLLLNLKLLDAAKSGNLKNLNYALDRKADINTVTKAGETVLYRAVYYRHIEMVKELLIKGANPTLEIHNTKETALDLAISSRQVEIIALLASSFLLCSAQNINGAGIIKALENGADLKAVDVHNRTALHLVCGDINEKLDINLIKMLIQKYISAGLDIHKGDNSGETALDYLKGNTLKVMTKSGEVPLHIYCMEKAGVYKMKAKLLASSSRLHGTPQTASVEVKQPDSVSLSPRTK